jgi:uncharacterized membrane protein YidH (DUF202 family)
MDILSSSLDD